MFNDRTRLINFFSRTMYNEFMTLRRNRKLILLVILIFAVLLVIAANVKTTKAIVSLPFGGLITFTEACNEGIRISVGKPIPKLYILTHGSVRLTPSFSVPRVGQFALGLFKPTPITCTKGNVPTGTGLPIIMAGGSSFK